MFWLGTRHSALDFLISGMTWIQFFVREKILFPPYFICSGAWKNKWKRRSNTYVSNVIYRSIYVHVRCAHCTMLVLWFVCVFSCAMCVLDMFRHFDCKSPPVVKTIIITKHAYLYTIELLSDAFFNTTGNKIYK